MLQGEEEEEEEDLSVTSPRVGNTELEEKEQLDQ
jgi:hypothetical protein